MGLMGLSSAYFVLGQRNRLSHELWDGNEMWLGIDAESYKPDGSKT